MSGALYLGGAMTGTQGTLPFYNQSFDFLGIFSFHSVVLLVIIIQLTAV